MSQTQVLLIMGSLREGSNTAKIACLAHEVMVGRDLSVDVVDPRTTRLAFPGLGDHPSCAEAIQKRVAAAAAAVFITPEYDGSFSSILKLIIEHFGYPSGLAGKPVALIGCAGGRIGAVKALEHLRSLLSHTGAVVLPLSHSVAMVHKAFDDDGSLLDPELKHGVEAVIAALCAFLPKV